MPASTTGSFTATGQSAAISGDHVDMHISGSFAASLSLQAEDMNGNWADVTGHSVAAPGFASTSCAGARNWRLACSSFTSGSAGYELTATTRTGRG